LSTPLHQNDHIQLWEHAHIQITAVHKVALEAETAPVSFALPSSGFLCTSRGSALVLLDSRVYAVQGLHVFHAAPKSWIELNPGKDGLDYWLILYTADLISLTPDRLHACLEAWHPFQTCYHVIPTDPAILYDTLDQMYAIWQQHQPMAQFQVKALFYQWIYHVVEQYHTTSSTPVGPDPIELVTTTLKYMLKHYASPLTLESLAAAMNLSPGHLSNRFKQVLNRGPIDCLIHLRMEKARKLLIETELPLRMIATAVGYHNVYYFSNAFKKHTGLAPSLLCKQHSRLESNLECQQEDLISSTGRYDIVEPKEPCYIDIDNYYQYNDGGFDHMFKFNKAVPAGLLLAFGLLLGGCGSSSPAAPANTGNSSNATVQSQPAGNAAKSNNNSGTQSQPTTKTVSSEMGDVEIPANPQRVVMDFYLGHLLALGIKPVGTNGVFMQNPYLEDQIEGIVDISDNLEAILSLDPDLIITGNAKNYEAYSKIAPTVFFTALSNVREEVQKLSVIVGKEAEGEAWLENFNKELAQAKERIGKILKDGETVTVFDGGILKTITLYGSAFTGRTIHGELGMPLHPNVQRDVDPKVGWAQISSELATNYASEHIFMAVDAKAESFDYAHDPLWSTFDAVKKNQLYEIDGYKFYFSDPISVMGQVHDITNLMEERTAANK